MKKPKTYRISERTQEAIERLKGLYPSRTETEIIEQAIQEMDRACSWQQRQEVTS